MSRTAGQSGSIEKKGSHYVVRFWQDVPGQGKRVHRSVQICPIDGPSSLTKPQIKHRAREIIQESRADTAEFLEKVEAVNLGTTFRQQAEWFVRDAQYRSRKPVKERTAKTWKSYLQWINPRIGDTPLCDFNNLALRDLIAQMKAAKFTNKTILNYTALVKQVVASAIGDNGEPLYPRKWNSGFIDLPIVEKQRTPIFTSAEIERIISRADCQCGML
jgi:hypothetical protein